MRRAGRLTAEAHRSLAALEDAARRTFLARDSVRTRPILFSGPMVRAILGRTKRVTRRVISLASAETPDFYDSVTYGEGGVYSANYGGAFTPVTCPYGVPGDRLWVRETWAPADLLVDGYDRDPPHHHLYRADGALRFFRGNDVPPKFRGPDEHGLNLGRVRWRPSIFMPLSASRLTLSVLEVSAERLHDIDPDDCAAEGLTFEDVGPARCWKDAFAELWDSINAARGFGWDVNPWVWRIRFGVVR